MNLIVNSTRNYIHSLGTDFFKSLRGINPFFYFCNNLILNLNINVFSFSLVDNQTAFYYNTFAHRFIFFIFQTPQKASLKIPMLILDSPNCLSINVMGTSAGRKPCFTAAYFIQIWKAYPLNRMLLKWIVSRTSLL